MTAMHGFPEFTSRVIPVVALDHSEQAVPLARALIDGGIDVIEVTLRTPAGLKAISILCEEVPEMVVTAGSVLSPDDFYAARDAGALAVFSPGATADLLAAGAQSAIPLVPGVATPSELMRAMASGYRLMKFFPAEPFGGVSALSAFAGPFPGARFCPTGGIHLSNLSGYLRHPSVAFVGGTWIAPLKLIRDQRWMEISRLAREATTMASEIERPR